MNTNSRYQVEGCAGLTAVEEQAAQALAEQVNQAEGLGLLLPLGFDEQQDQQHERFFLVYDDRRLVGFAGVQEAQPPEVVGLVHPEYRRRGIGTALLASVRDGYRQRGVERLLLISDEASEAGRAFLAAVGARFLSAEYRLILDPALVDRSLSLDALQVRPAADDDIAALVQVQARSFGDPEEAVREMIEKSLRDPQRQYLIGELDGRPVGCLRIGRYADLADFTAFGVLPELRGRGIGRRMLLFGVGMLLDEGRRNIVIEVATDNRNALGLYLSCGFRQGTTYGFYELRL